MTKKMLLILAALLIVAVMISACSSSEEWDVTDEPYDDDSLVTDVPVDDSAATDASVTFGEPSSTCMMNAEAWLNDEGESSNADTSLEADQEYILVTYQISGDEIASPDIASGIPDEFVVYQDDTADQERIWQFITDVIPTDQRTMLTEFVIFSDGYSNTMGAVDQADTANGWTIEMDIVDAADMSSLSVTIIHEFGHMLTLNDQQINNKSSCSTYSSIDGCTNSDSYINAFYNTFWKDIYEEWASTVEFADGEVNEDQVEVFYEQYPDQFVTDYAATGPEEDIAESWMYFVMSDKPAGNTIAEQKILFFYDYPELVQLRESMLNGLCQYSGQ